MRAHYTPEKITGMLAKESNWNDQLQELLPIVFNDLRQLARYYFAREAQPDHTLQPTALISEVYLRLVGSKAPRPMNRKEFFIFAGRLIREILLDHARARQAVKRGRGVPRLALEEALGVAVPELPDPAILITIDRALERLNQVAPRQCRVVELRYFTGLTFPQIADVLGVSVATVERDWGAARRWLILEMES